MKANKIYAIFAIVVAIGLFVLVGMNRIPYVAGLAFIAGSVIPVLQMKDKKENESNSSKNSG